MEGKWEDDTPQKEDDDEPCMGIEAHNKQAAKEGLVEDDDTEIDEFEKGFYPRRPKRKNPKGMAKMGEPLRKERFLQSFDATGGIFTTSYEDAGIDKDKFDKWMESDPEFKKKYEFTNQKICDRLVYILNMKTGVVRALPWSHMKRIDTNAIIRRLQVLQPEKYGDKVSGTFTIKLDIPRPQRDSGQLPAEPAADRLPHDPS